MITLARMRRREFVAMLCVAAAVSPAGAWAEKADRRVRIGVLLGVTDDTEGEARVAAFRKGMQELGWTEDHNLQLDVRSSAGAAEKGRNYAAELVGLAPDVIVANTSAVVAALREKTRTIPIVFVQVVDPVSSGFVDSLARPGGNITGFASSDYGAGAKWLELLKKIAPRVVRVGVLRDPSLPGGAGQLGAVQALAPSFGVELKALDVRGAPIIEQGLEALSRSPDSGLIVLTSPAATVHRALIVALAERYRLPAIYPYRFYAKSGGLLSYGIDNLDLWRRSASYVDRILKGAKPGDLPVQQPAKYELIVNLKTARALGLSVPDELLVRADEVIE
jgi:putative ABC transport system substrate-binding protein